MSTRHLSYLLVFALLSVSNMGCCRYMHRYGAGCGGQMYGSGCASCGCPEASCCCEDTCCEAACGCSDCCEPACGCTDYCCEPECGCTDCCEASCGCNDVGCGSCVGGRCPLLGNCLIMRRLRKAFRGCAYNSCDSYNGCCSEGYWSEWHNDPPCNCQSASAGGHYGGAYGRRAFLAKQHANISDDLRVADEGTGPVLR